MNGSTKRALVEMLESRKLLSVTLPSAVGNFTGTFDYNGTPVTLDLDILTQKRASLGGVGAISAGSQTGRINGSINAKGIVHLTAHPGKATGSFVGTLTGDTLSGTLKYRFGKTHVTGPVTLSRAPS